MSQCTSSDIKTLKLVVLLRKLLTRFYLTIWLYRIFLMKHGLGDISGSYAFCRQDPCPMGNRISPILMYTLASLKNIDGLL